MFMYRALLCQIDSRNHTCTYTVAHTRHMYSRYVRTYSTREHTAQHTVCVHTVYYLYSIMNSFVPSLDLRRAMAALCSLQ